MTFLLDTNVISELRKRRPDPGVVAWYRTTDSEQLFISCLTIGEVRLGIERLRRKDIAQAERLEEWLHGLLLDYHDHIIPLDTRACEEWGRINVPDPLPVIDGLLAASAKVRGWTLVSRNNDDLARSGVSLLNPFGTDDHG